jgi:hypothetical protein
VIVVVRAVWAVCGPSAAQDKVDCVGVWRAATWKDRLLAARLGE